MDAIQKEFEIRESIQIEMNNKVEEELHKLTKHQSLLLELETLEGKQGPGLTPYYTMLFNKYLIEEIVKLRLERIQVSMDLREDDSSSD